MAKATRDRGFEYFGVADHSKSAHYAGGLSVEQIEQQHREADRLNKKSARDFRILKGIESDILADGSLDYPEDVLATFDFVVACIHGRFKMDRVAQTDRLLRAIANPFTTIIGHMPAASFSAARDTKSISRRCFALVRRTTWWSRSMRIHGDSTSTGAGTRQRSISDA
jgi:histidinol phosphatase-like PHP family hydrolase